MLLVVARVSSRVTKNFSLFHADIPLISALASLSAKNSAPTSALILTIFRLARTRISKARAIGVKQAKMLVWMSFRR